MDDRRAAARYRPPTMIIVIGFLAMVALLLAQLFFDVGYDAMYAQCPTCGMRGVRIAQVWEMYPEAPWCRECGARFHYRDGVLVRL
jgi:hypothetical protein